MRRDFGAGKRLGKRAALAPIISPEQTGREAKRFTQPTRAGHLERRPEQNENAGQRQRCSSETLQGFPAHFGPSFPEQGPYRRCPQIERYVRGGGITQRPVEADNVHRKDQTPAPPEIALELRRERLG